ncbi:MAG: lysozyme [Gammaproteobacteria bacterium]
MALVQKFEGLRLSAYKDSGGTVTIGWGHTTDVEPGTECTRAQAMDWLRDDIQSAVVQIQDTVTVQLTQNQFDALVSWVYNLGGASWRYSQALRMLNSGRYRQCIAHMALYDRCDGRRLPGLARRRAAEVALWEETDAEKPGQSG